MKKKNEYNISISQNELEDMRMATGRGAYEVGTLSH